MNLSYKSGQIENALVACKFGALLGQNKILESLEDLSTMVRFRKIYIRHLNATILRQL